MLRPLRDYTRHDWARLRPVTQTYKTLCYDAVNALYMRRGRVDAALAARLRGRGIVCSIAFNNDWAIDRQARLMRRYVAGAEYLVAHPGRLPPPAARLVTHALRAGGFRRPDAADRIPRG